MKEKKVKMSTLGDGLIESGHRRTLLVQSLIISLHKSFKHWRLKEQHFTHNSLLFTSLKKRIKQYNPVFILPQNLVPVLCFLCFPFCIVQFHLSCVSTITLAPAPVLGQDTQHSCSSGISSSLFEELWVCLPATPLSGGERVFKAMNHLDQNSVWDSCIWDPKMTLNSVMCKSNLKIPTAKGFRSHLCSSHGLSKYVESKLIDKERGRTLFAYRFWFTESLISLPITECRSHLHLTTLPVLTVVQPMHLNTNCILHRILAEALIGPSMYFMKAFSYYRGYFFTRCCAGSPLPQLNLTRVKGEQRVWEDQSCACITNHQQCQRVQNVQKPAAAHLKGSL